LDRCLGRGRLERSLKKKKVRGTEGMRRGGNTAQTTLKERGGGGGVRSVQRRTERGKKKEGFSKVLEKKKLPWKIRVAGKEAHVGG